MRNNKFSDKYNKQKADMFVEWLIVLLRPYQEEMEHNINNIDNLKSEDS